MLKNNNQIFNKRGAVKEAVPPSTIISSTHFMKWTYVLGRTSVYFHISWVGNVASTYLRNAVFCYKKKVNPHVFRLCTTMLLS